MISKRRISEIRSLHHAKFRNQQRLLIAEGEKVVADLLQSGWIVESIYATDLWSTPVKTGIAVEHVSEAELLKISLLEHPNKVLAIARYPEIPTEIKLPADQPVLALDGIRDPGNLGTLIRTAEWFGIRHILCSSDTADCFNPKVVQSAMGSLFRTTISYCDLPETISQATKTGLFQPVAATMEGKNYRDLKLEKNPMLIIGSESHGVRKEVLHVAKYQVSIPSKPGSGAESLNAAIACGILLAHYTK